MKRQTKYSIFACSLILVLASWGSCKRTSTITKVEMHLSAFGVESDEYPSVDAVIDFEHDSSNCLKWFYNPSHQSSNYKLSSNETRKALDLLQKLDLQNLKEYKSNISDEPTSTTTIYTSSGNYVIKDYGLKAGYPLQQLYKLVYEF